MMCVLPLVACLMDVATGGAYYLATAADHIVAHPTTVTGAVGVILNLYNLEEFDGRIFTARQAIERGLVDSLGYLDDAVAMAGQLGGCPTAKVVILHRCNDRARSPYAVTPNVPLQGNLLPISVPGFDRSQMPTFLYLWQPEPTIQRRAAR